MREQKGGDIFPDFIHPQTLGSNMQGMSTTVVCAQRPLLSSRPLSRPWDRPLTLSWIQPWIRLLTQLLIRHLMRLSMLPLTGAPWHRLRVAVRRETSLTFSRNQCRRECHLLGPKALPRPHLAPPGAHCLPHETTVAAVAVSAQRRVVIGPRRRGQRQPQPLPRSFLAAPSSGAPTAAKGVRSSFSGHGDAAFR